MISGSVGSGVGVAVWRRSNVGTGVRGMGVVVMTMGVAVGVTGVDEQAAASKTVKAMKLRWRMVAWVFKGMDYSNSQRKRAAIIALR